MCCCNKKCKYAHVCFDENKDRSCDGFCLNTEANLVIKGLLISIQNIAKTIQILDSVGLSVEGTSESESDIGSNLWGALTNDINSLHYYLDLKDIDATTNYILNNIGKFDGHVNAFINNLICSV